MVDRRIGKAEEYLIRNHSGQFPVFKQIRKQPVGIVPADGAEDHIDSGILQGLQQIGSALFGMVPDVFDPLQRMGHEGDIQPQSFQSFYPDLQFMLCKILSEDSA